MNEITKEGRQGEYSRRTDDRVPPSLTFLGILLLLAGCALHRMPTAAPSHPLEHHVLSETARFAARLGVKVQGVITTKPYMVPAIAPLYDGEKVPAAGRYVYGRIEYFRPVVQYQTREYLTSLAAHEVCHVRHHGEAEAGACARELLR